VFVSPKKVSGLDSSHRTAILLLTYWGMLSFHFMPSWRAIDSNATNAAQRIAFFFPPPMRVIPTAGCASHLLQV
jgi:hypothetical protein